MDWVARQPAQCLILSTLHVSWCVAGQIIPVVILCACAVLFGIFTLCMLIEQLTTVMTNETAIDRLQAQRRRPHRQGQYEQVDTTDADEELRPGQRDSIMHRLTYVWWYRYSAYRRWMRRSWGGGKRHRRGGCEYSGRDSVFNPWTSIVVYLCCCACAWQMT